MNSCYSGLCCKRTSSKKTAEVSDRTIIILVDLKDLFDDVFLMCCIEFLHILAESKEEFKSLDVMILRLEGLGDDSNIIDISDIDL